MANKSDTIHVRVTGTGLLIRGSIIIITVVLLVALLGAAGAISTTTVMGICIALAIILFLMVALLL